MDGWTDGPTDIRSPPPIPPPASAALSDFEAEETNSREKRERILRKLFLLLRDLTYLRLAVFASTLMANNFGGRPKRPLSKSF